LPVVDAVVLANGTLNALAVAEVVIVAFVEFVAVVAVPLKDAVIVFAAKLPEASRATIVEAPFTLVAVVLAFATVPLDIAVPFNEVKEAPEPLNTPATSVLVLGLYVNVAVESCNNP
jgi:hypothetical protein